MSVQQLARLIPPPAKPREVGTVAQWQAVERDLGTALPSDYREFIERYGSGLLARFYVIFSPFSSNENVALLSCVRSICKYQREFQQEWSDRVTYPIWPEPGGLLPWGTDDNGNDYFWRTNGAPDQWIVAHDDMRNGGYRLHDCSMSEFLVQILTGEIAALTGNYPRDDDLIFEPF